LNKTNIQLLQESLEALNARDADRFRDVYRFFSISPPWTILVWLYFYVIISSAIEPKLKSHPQMIYVLSLRSVASAQIEDYIKIGDTPP